MGDRRRVPKGVRRVPRPEWVSRSGVRGLAEHTGRVSLPAGIAHGLTSLAHLRMVCWEEQTASQGSAGLLMMWLKRYSFMVV